jgi:hypothetical protein
MASQGARSSKGVKIEMKKKEKKMKKYSKTLIKIIKNTTNFKAH